jgi:hypothetical protein
VPVDDEKITPAVFGRHFQNIYDFLGQPVQLPMPLGPGGTASMTYRADHYLRASRARKRQGVLNTDEHPIGAEKA